MFKNGLHTDTEPHVQPEETYRKLLNGTLVQEEGIICTEPGTTIMGSLGLPLVGKAAIGNGQMIILVGDGTRSKIFSFDGYSLVLLFDDDIFDATNKLNLDPKYPCHVEIRIGYSNQIIVYWTDGNNPSRSVNLSRLPAVGTEFSIHEINLFSELTNIPSVTLTAVDEGGRLKAGTYQFALAYVDSDNTASNYFHVTSPIFIGKGTIDATKPITSGLGSPSGEPTAKRIRFTFDDLDFTYSRLRVAVLYYEKLESPDAEEDPEISILPDILYNDIDTVYGSGVVPDPIELVYTGFESVIPGALGEILIPRPSYRTAKALAQSDGVLYLGNLRGNNTDIGYQKYANGISIECTDENVNVNSYGDPVFMFDRRTFKRDEIYGFYIAFVLKDGTESKAYHIPGREAEGTEIDALTGPLAADLGSLPGIKDFHAYGTAGTNGFAYWENANEEYAPNDDSEIWTVDGNNDGVDTLATLAGEKVRHHHFPEQFSAPYTVDGDDYNIFRLRLINFVIPNDIREQIIGWKFYYVRRSFGNQTILDQGFGQAAYEEGPDTDEDGDIHFNSSIPGLVPTDAPEYISNIIAIYPFRMLRLKQNIGFISYIKGVFKTGGSGFTIVGPWSGADAPDSSVQIARRIENRTYVEADTQSTSILIGSTYKTIANGREEAKIVLELTNVLPTGTNTYLESYVWNIHAYVPDLYTPYNQQQLVSTGEIYTLPAIGVTTTDYFSGGDTYIHVYGLGIFRSRHREEEFDDPETEPDEHVYPFWITGQGTRWWDYEGSDNPAMRYDGQFEWQKAAFKNFLYPILPHNPFEEPEPESIVPLLERFKNWDGYNFAYSLLNAVKTTFPVQIISNPLFEYPTRVIRSAKFEPGVDADGFRIFKDQDYRDFPTLRGEIVTLKGAGDTLIVHCVRGGFRTRGREELTVEDTRAFLGAGDIFTTSPQELATTDGGYAGVQDMRAAVVTPYGYAFVDEQAGKAFLYGTELEEISAFGIEKDLKTVFAYNLEEYGFVRSPESNPWIGCILIDDPHLNRIVITKKDLSPTQLFLTEFDEGNIKFEDNTFHLLIDEEWEPILYSDITYFIDGSNTYVYLPDRKKWEGTKSFLPQGYLALLNWFYSVKDNNLYRHSLESIPGNFYGTAFPIDLEIVQKGDPTIDRIAGNVLFDTFITDWITDIEQQSETFSEVTVYNTHQTTGPISLVPFPTEGYNVRRTKRIWSFNRIRSNSERESTAMPSWAYKQRLSSKYHIAKLVYNNTAGALLRIISAAIQERPSIR